jgi:hypothetical protein
MKEDHYQKLVEDYKAKVRKEFGERSQHEIKVTSREYTEFKSELYPKRYSWYEKACNTSAKILKFKTDPKKSMPLIKNLKITHLDVTPSSVSSFAILAGLIIMFGGVLLSLGIPFALGINPPLFLAVFFMIAGLLVIPALQKIPQFMANTWRMKASNQMVQSIFYLVTYMRHTSNLERAIGFAADHLDPPLSLDFRKMIWDVETQKYSTIKDSSEAYLEFWKEWDREFVEAFHLVEASLFESSEQRRISLLDKSLDVILTGTYENMLHYAHNLKSPITILHMLGIILPILGLVILPLVVSFLSSSSSPLNTAIYIALLYNISLPIGVYYLGQTILSKRPAGYGASDIGERKNLKKYRNVNFKLAKNFTISINPLYFSVMIFIVLALIGLSPIILHTVAPSFELSFDNGNYKFLEYICPPRKDCPPTNLIGPYGLGASVISLILILGIGLSIGTFYALRSKNVIKIRNRTKELEEEFSSALFQLGNRLGDGLPAEIAFAKVAVTMRGTTSGQFFSITEQNITRLGMGIEQAIFDPKVGAVSSFPSKIIEASMKVLIESIKKGPRIAAQALLSMSRYIKEIHRVEERLKDLMADVIASMKSQVKFLTPAIAGIVIGITSMISTILTRLGSQLQELTGEGQVSTFGGVLDIFGIGIPTFYFQIIVGIYIVQIAFILTKLSSGVENGSDKLGERFELGRNLVRSTILYCLIAGAVMILFNLFAGTIFAQSIGI